MTSRRNDRAQGAMPLRRSAEHGFVSLKRVAENGFTPLRRSAEHGFTLVELMIVITIVALMSAAVVLAMPDPRGRLVDEAERFAARAKAARDAAVVESHSINLSVSAQGYSFEARRAGRWMKLADKPFRPEEWSDGTVAVAAGGRSRVTFDSTGLASQRMEVTLLREGVRSTVVIDTDGTVRIDG
ncbi:general secretion pathway protein H [Sphingomonas zeicaulis]|uniref:GspH/FimT family pseudopilin n=1 Tax=Sphingomonas zeicaulis TaxID=1632740 RepID=UPI003D1DD3AE